MGTATRQYKKNKALTFWKVKPVTASASESVRQLWHGVTIRAAGCCQMAQARKTG